ncbi:MAG TPA: ParB/RepB/Spo0J family partition protein [Casimicrobiaceae bacterium]|jgi:ParB family chromosome partitioning protein|nr:ParB/RepB/Spo0J family partition protein [Casimicrobiaceae bacterium]
MAKLKGLGRGLDALLSGSTETPSRESLQTIALDRIRPGKYQPRSRMDEASLDELAASIKAQGVMQPILVRPVDANRFEIIAGERRWLAARRAGLAEVPALVREVPDQAALALALIENIQREDLNPLEEAQGIKRLIEEFGLTHEAAGEAVGRSRSAVTNLLRLTQLAKPVQDYLLSGELDMGHARALLGLPAAQQAAAAAKVVALGMSVRDTERMMQAAQHPAPKKKRRLRGKSADADLARLENELSDALGTSVHIEATRDGAGRIVVAYSSLDQLDGILAKLR